MGEKEECQAHFGSKIVIICYLDYNILRIQYVILNCMAEGERLGVAREEIGKARTKILDVSDQIDLETAHFLFFQAVIGLLIIVLITQYFML